MVRPAALIIFSALYLPTCAQTQQWHETLRDTLTINNCPPTLLWQEYGLSKAAVFEVCAYRDAVGEILTYDELIPISSLDSTMLHPLIEQLPLDRPTERRGGTSASSRLRPSSATPLQTNIQHPNGQWRASWHRDKGMQYGGFLQSRQQVGAVELNVLTGQFFLSAGQGLVLSAPTFGVPQSREFFGRGLRGTASAYGSESGWAVEAVSGSLTAALGRGEDGGLGRAQWEGQKGYVGAAWRGDEASVYGKWYGGNWRYYGEWSREKQWIGVNGWMDDVLVEGNVEREGTQWVPNMLMSGRAVWGDWQWNWRAGQVSARWQKGRWQVFVAKKEWMRTVVSYKNDGFKVQCYGHGGSRGLSVRKELVRGEHKWQWMWAAAEVRQGPIWMTMPYMPGSIPSMALYDDFFGGAVGWRYKGMALMGSWNVGEAPEVVGSLRWDLRELAPVLPKIRITLGHYFRMLDGQGHEHGKRGE